MTSSSRLLIAVMLGGAFGAVARFVVVDALGTAGLAASVSLVAVNVAGAFALGWMRSDAAAGREWASGAVVFLTTGLLGTFTTFSGYIVESVELWRLADFAAAAVLLVGSVGFGLGAAVAGRKLGER